MSITEWAAGEVFMVRVYKRLASNPAVVWANSYELSADTPRSGGAEAGRDAAIAIANWEALFHQSQVEFDRAVFSSWVPDGTPYDPTTFAVRPISGLAGARSIGGTEPLPLQATLFLRRNVEFGRPGRALYRGVLFESDVTSPAGTPALTDPAREDLTTRVNSDLPPPFPSQKLGDFLASLGLSLVLAGGQGPNPQHVRAVTSFTPAGVSVRKFNNRYYDLP